MPTIQYPKHPNTDTAFVIQDDGKKNRALMIAPQDITSLELPENPNSTKGYVTVSGKKQRVVLTADISGSGGGGGGAVTSVNGKTGDVVLTAKDVDALAQFDTMPAASADNANDIVQYTGTTNASYTNGYIYKNVATIVYTSTVSFEAATLSASTIACSGDDFAAFVAEWGSGDITTITNGTLTYDQSGGLLVFVGKDANNTTVCTFQLYTEDYQDAGFTITGTLQDGDVFVFTCEITEASASYVWTRIDVQPTPDPLPTQTGNAGKFLTTDGTDASWGNALANNATGTDSIGVSSFDTKGDRNMNLGGKILASAAGYGNIAIGYGCDTGSTNNNNNVGCIVIGYGANMYNANNKDGCVAIGFGNLVTETGAIAIGARTDARAVGAIQLGSKAGTTSHWTNSDANTFKVGNQNGNFEIMSADGTIPHARLTNAVSSTSVTIATTDWSSNTASVTVSGLTATSVVWVAPDNASQSAYLDAGVYASSQTTDTLTFTCTQTPASALTINIVFC